MLRMFLFLLFALPLILPIHASAFYHDKIWRDMFYVFKEVEGGYMELTILFNYSGTRFAGLAKGHGNLAGCDIMFDGKAKDNDLTLFGQAHHRVKYADGTHFTPWSFISLDKRGNRVVVKTEYDGKDYPMDEFCDKYGRTPPNLPAEMSFYPQK